MMYKADDFTNQIECSLRLKSQLLTWKMSKDLCIRKLTSRYSFFLFAHANSCIDIYLPKIFTINPYVHEVILVYPRLTVLSLLVK
jgi:hypothetical protein